LHAQQLLTGQHKKICARMDARAQRILHGALTFACKLRPDSDQIKDFARAQRVEVTGQGEKNKKWWRAQTLLSGSKQKKKSARPAEEMTGHAGCDRIKKISRQAISRRRRPVNREKDAARPSRM
jgi:hypothetical protein